MSAGAAEARGSAGGSGTNGTSSTSTTSGRARFTSANGGAQGPITDMPPQHHDPRVRHAGLLLRKFT